jgi:hypothetical protein
MNSTGSSPYLLLILALVFIVLIGRRTLRPRRFRRSTLLIGPAIVLVAVVSTVGAQPMLTVGLGLALIPALVAGGGVGWLRAKLIKLEFDPATDMLTMRGTPYGLLLLVILFVLRSGLRIITLQHPEWGINLNTTTDLLIVFAFGIVCGYAAELYRAAGRVRNAASPAS